MNLSNVWAGTIALSVLASAMIGSGAQAQDGPLQALLVEGGAGPVLSYVDAGCGLECPIAGFVCGPADEPSLWLAALPHEEIRNWLFHAVPPAEPATAMLVLDGIPYPLLVEELSVGGGGDLLSNWWVGFSITGRWLEGLGGATVATIETPAGNIALSGALDDSRARSGFVAACAP